LKAKLKRTKADVERIVIISDIHFPYHDPIALTTALSFIKAQKPHTVIMNGDVVDHFAISKYCNESERVTGEFEVEVALAKSFFKDLRKLVGPDATIIWNEGNHEVRLKQYIMANAPALAGLECLTMEGLYELDEYGIIYNHARNRGAFINLGGVNIGHFDVVSKHSAYTAKNLVDAHHTSIVQGHTHRLGVHYKTTLNGTVKGVEGGCLCSTEPSYLDTCNWQQGLVLMERERGNDRYNITEVPIIEGKILLGGIRYE